MVGRVVRRAGKAAMVALAAGGLALAPPTYGQTQTVTFDFDTGAPALSSGQSTPLDQTAGGLTAHFSSPTVGAGGFSVQSDATTQFHLSQFSGHYLYPNTINNPALDIQFSQALTSVTFVFATADFQQVEVPTTIQLTAYENSTGTPPVGSATAHGTYASDTMPMGTLTFTSATPFNVVEIAIPPAPLAASDFLVDNITVTTASQAPTDTPTDTPTNSPQPTDTPTATGTASPTSTPTQTNTPTPSVAVCAPAPLSGCATPAKGSVKMQGNGADATKQKLTWQWSGGTANRSDFGDPIGGTTNYRLCVYDDGVLKMNPAVAEAGTCDGKPCWKESKTGFTYKNRSGNADGITQMTLKAGNGKAKVAVQGKGARLSLPFPIGDTTAITVQLVKNPGSGPECWALTFPQPAKVYDAAKLKFWDKIP